MSALFNCTFVVWFGFEEMSEIRRPMAADRCFTRENDFLLMFYDCRLMVGISVVVEGFVVGLSIWVIGSVH